MREGVDLERPLLGLESIHGRCAARLDVHTRSQVTVGLAEGAG
jgi:hypothetical protein